MFSRHDAIKNVIHTSLLLYFSAPSGRQLASNRTPFSGEKEMMKIPLKRREYLRELQSDTFTSPDLFLGDGGRIEIVSLFAPEVRYATCNQSEQGSKTLLFFDQSDKSPYSGLRADDWKSKCIRRPFSPSQVNKNHLIADYLLKASDNNVVC